MIDKGLRIEFTAFGPEFSEASRRELFHKIDCLAALLGGRQILSRVCSIVCDADSVHDGMWMMGNRVAGLYQSKTPSLPLGWLVALAARHLKSGTSTQKPEVEWKSLVDLAIDMAAVLDCERYSQFEGMDMHPSEFWRSLQDSLFWKEFFTLPQVPANVLKVFAACIPQLLAEAGNTNLSKEAESILREANTLAEFSKVGSPILHPKNQVEKYFPTLIRLGKEAAHGVNAELDDIFIAGKRNQDSIVFFETENNAALLSMPRSIMSAAVCDLLFRRIWKKAGKDSDKIVGRCFEAALAKAGEGKAPNLFIGKCYQVEKQIFEFDFAGREAEEITLFEVKSKSITAQTRQGSVLNFISDISQSLLPLLKQLMTHERNIRNGFSPIVKEGEITDNFRPIKIAVSPLTYGPISDKAFVNSVIRGLYNIKLTPVPDLKVDNSSEVITEFNEALRQVQELIKELAPRKDGKVNIFPYLMDVYWLDLGEAIYALSRADTLRNAVAPLRHMTFGSRDFWTEVGFADKQGLTIGKWKPLTPAASL